MRRKRWILIAATLASGLILALGLAVLTLQSRWFYNYVRARMVTTVETATGGRVEIGAFRFNWKLLRAEVDNFTLHGTEPPDKPPLFHAASVAVGLKIVSLWNRDVNIQYLDVAGPQIDLIVAPDGRTNIPQPKIPGSGKDPTETILNLAIDRFHLWNGVFDLDSHQETPFALQGQNLNLGLTYDATVPRYHGDISMQPLEAQVAGFARTPLAFTASVSLERNRIGIDSAKVSTSGVDIQLTGVLQDLTAPHLSVKYVARATMSALERILKVKLMDRGDMIVSGDAQWAGPSDFAARGSLHAYNLDYRSGALRLRNFRADGAIAAGPKGVNLTALRFSGNANAVDVTGRVEAAALRGKDLDLRAIALAAMDGSFQGDGRLVDLDRFTVSGEFAGMDIRRVAALYTPQPLPWDGLVLGTAKLEGSLKRIQDISASTNATIVPAQCGAGASACQPIHGQIAATYDGRADTLDLGRSTISLPNSRADFSGILGRALTVHLQTTNLDDLLPVLGAGAASAPVKLQNGSAIFDGIVKGTIEAPHASGRLRVANVQYNQDLIDSLAGDVDASPDSLSLRNAAITHGAMHADFQGTLALRDWKAEPASAISASGAIRNAKAADLVALLKPGTLKADATQIAGTLSATAQVSGTMDDPHAVADITLLQGAFQGEPFDRIAAHATYTSKTIELTGGQFNAGAKQVTLTASYTHDPGRFDAGRLRFQLASNAMPLQQIHTLQQQRPGAAGSVQIDANGTIDVGQLLATSLSPAKPGRKLSHRRSARHHRRARFDAERPAPRRRAHNCEFAERRSARASGFQLRQFHHSGRWPVAIDGRPFGQRHREFFQARFCQTAKLDLAQGAGRRFHRFRGGRAARRWQSAEARCAQGRIAHTQVPGIPGGADRRCPALHAR